MTNPFRASTVGMMAPGTMLGRYRVVRTLGRGGMGVVLLAQDTVLQLPVCIKLLHDHYVDHEEAAARFTREIVLARRVVHRSVCRVHDLHEHEGRRFLTMEYIEGTPLHQIADEAGASMSVERALRLVRNICLALQAAHDVGVIHRDLKPRNIMVRAPETALEPDEVSILDFGIATASDAARDGLTRPGVAMGTRRFIAPEVWQGKSASIQSDVFAAGVILHHLLTGDYPWTQRDGAELFEVMRTSLPTRPSQQRPGLSRFVDDVVAQALAADPSQRTASARALAVSCDELLSIPGDANHDETQQGSIWASHDATVELSTPHQHASSVEVSVGDFDDAIATRADVPLAVQAGRLMLRPLPPPDNVNGLRDQRPGGGGSPRASFSSEDVTAPSAHGSRSSTPVGADDATLVRAAPRVPMAGRSATPAARPRSGVIRLEDVVASATTPPVSASSALIDESGATDEATHVIEAPRIPPTAERPRTTRHAVAKPSLVERPPPGGRGDGRT